MFSHMYRMRYRLDLLIVAVVDDLALPTLETLRDCAQFLWLDSGLFCVLSYQWCSQDVNWVPWMALVHERVVSKRLVC